MCFYWTSCFLWWCWVQTLLLKVICRYLVTGMQVTYHFFRSCKIQREHSTNIKFALKMNTDICGSCEHFWAFHLWNVCRSIEIIEIEGRTGQMKHFFTVVVFCFEIKFLEPSTNFDFIQIKNLRNHQGPSIKRSRIGKVCCSNVVIRVLNFVFLWCFQFDLSFFFNDPHLPFALSFSFLIKLFVCTDKTANDLDTKAESVSVFWILFYSKST